MEGLIEGLTGWAIGDEKRHGKTKAAACATPPHSRTKVDRAIIPMFRNDRDRFVEVMRHAIAVNGSFFNSKDAATICIECVLPLRR
jgi:glycogen phosphorylase